jgi:hypothetical protein
VEGHAEEFVVINNEGNLRGHRSHFYDPYPTNSDWRRFTLNATSARSFRSAVRVGFRCGVRQRDRG